MANTANLGAYRPGCRATCLALAFLLAIIGTVPAPGAEASRPRLADRCPGADCAAPPARGVTVYRGLVLDYEVIDGMAVHGGDMVLGTAAEAAAAAPSRGAPEPKRSGGPARRDIAGVSSASLLWPGGRVPYEIDDAFEGEQLAWIRAAIEEWNSKTVISLFPRTYEDAYVRFAPDSSGACRTGVGYVPGRPRTVILPPSCGTGAVIHEIGHAVGLLHEHERPDRDRFIVVPIEATRRDAGLLAVAWVSEYRDWLTGPYDYRSVMHYWPSGGAFSIPRGIPIAGPRGLSAGDIDGVARLYGEPPGTVTIATNPPGLEVLVDGETVTAPAAFAWLPGSVHTLEAPVLGDRESRPHVFGRWNDDGGRKRTVTVADSTWFEANYIPLERVSAEVSPPGAGTVALHPESPDGWYPRGSPVTVTATGPNARISKRRDPDCVPSIIHPFRDETMVARYPAPPLFRIESNVTGLLFKLNNRIECLTPAAFHPSELPARSRVHVADEFVPLHWDLDRYRQTPASGGRYRFSGWSDGGEREHEIEVPAEGGSLTLRVEREFELVAHAGRGGEIVVSPASEDGFHPSGAQVQLTAVPAEGRYFLGWEHDLAGTEATRSVVMDRDRLAVARFSATEPVPVPFGAPVPVESLDGRHFVRVPEGTSAVAVRFESSPAVRDAELYVTGGNGYPPFSTRLRASDTITLPREALSRLKDNARLSPSFGTNYLQIRQRGGSDWGGNLHVSVQRDWIGGVWPPAFTFVSAAGWSRPLRQTLRVTPVAGEVPPVRYRIVSDSHWLEAFPPEWTGGQGEVEVAVTANGAALAPEAYGGKLKVLIDRGGDPAAGWTPTGIEIPVHFVVKPTDGAGEPPGGGASGLVGGEAREAATEMAAGVAARGRLERVGDEDWFRFRTTAATSLITAYTVSDGDTSGELHVAGRHSPVADDDSGSGANFRIVTSVPAGTHYLRVRGFGTADYTLTLEAVPDDHGATREAATEIAVGAAARGRLEAVGDEDWFRFRTTAVTTWVTAHTASEGGAAGELQGSLSPALADGDSGSGANFWSTARVPAGTHYLRVSGRGTADYTLTVRETLDMEFVRIPAGSFVMGSPEEERRPSDERQREVRISQDFWMGKYEVTQGEWEALMGENPSYFKNCGLACPVEQVSWEDVQKFIRNLNARESGSGHAYRLPTEAEWEYAARAGTAGARYGELDEIAWHRGNSGGRTHAVGQKRANAWGLHDMLGNVREWTADWYGAYSGVLRTDPLGPATGSLRVVRGGGTGQSPAYIRAADRHFFVPGYRFSGFGSFSGLGFRLVRTEADGSSGSSGLVGGDDHGDAREAATEIAVGASAAGRLQGVGDADWFRFQTTAETTWVTASTVSDGDTDVELHVAGSLSPLADDGSGSGGNFRIAARVPAGTHYLRVSGRGTAGYTLTLRETLDMEFVRIPAGNFVMMGHDYDERHKVQISRDFWIGKYEVTLAEWVALTGESSNPGQRGNHPVTGRSWEEIQEFIRKLNERESGSGWVYRLPTEAEWEYAARAGATGARYGALDEIAWHYSNSEGRTHPVGEKRANAWGLHDMLGNAWEWTADWYGAYPSGLVTDPQGPSTGTSRVVRGGGRYSLDWEMTFALRKRFGYPAGHRDLGFRLVRSPAGGSSSLVAEDDHGDAREAATEVAAGTSARGRIERIGDEDWFRFQTTASHTWITAFTESEGDTLGELHVAGSDSPLADDDSGSGANFRIAAIVPAGTHFLRVRGFGTPDYTLTLARDDRAEETAEAMEFVRIPAGSFVMGSPFGEDFRQDDERQHEVTLSQGFWMGKYEVTQGEWEAVMGENPSVYKRCGPRCPVERVSWEDVQEFIHRLNGRESSSGYRYRLPTEAEWEYAARAGTTGPLYGDLDEIAWHGRNSGEFTTHPVGQKLANAWGLHDMLGNVAEWTADWYGEYSWEQQTDPRGPVTGERRVIRGGAYRSSPWLIRSADRRALRPDLDHVSWLGFRLVRTN